QIDFIVYSTQQIGLSEGRTPDGDPHWQKFSPPNPGVSNPATISTPTTSVPLIAITDSWRYNQANIDLYTQEPNWYTVGGNDTNATLGWAGPSAALFYNETAALPAPKNTPLTLIQPPATTDTPTFYFRIHFNLTAPLASVESLQLQTVLDDGAIVYLNGQQVFSLGMPTNVPINHQTYTQTGGGNGRNVGDAVYEGPFSLPLGSLVEGDN